MSINTEHNVTLTEGEISVVLFNLEKNYGHLLDGEIPEEVQTIFSKLEGVIDIYYDKLEAAKKKQPDMEWQPVKCKPIEDREASNFFINTNGEED